MHWLIVTGAGASRRLGHGAPLPLMADWSDALRRELNETERGLATAAGLRAGLTGVEYEAALGALLRWHDLRQTRQQFAGLGAEVVGELSEQIQRFLDRQDERVAAVVRAVNVTLYREFGSSRVEEAYAVEAYRLLLDALGTITTLSIVSTNYDAAAEIAVAGLGMRPDTGFQRRPGRTPTLQVEGLIQRSSERTSTVPVLHLHGAVGWYEREGQVRELSQDQPFNETLGRPVVLYPDPDKDPMRDPLVQSLWGEFDDALGRASAVVVVGHSLHDPALVRRLVAIDDKPIAVAVCPPGDAAAASRVRELVPKCDAVELTFGPQPIAQLHDFRSWVEAHRA